MKLSKLAAGLFAAVGTVLLIGSIVLCFVGLNRPSEGIQPPEAAQNCADAVLEAIDSGDFSGAAERFYGQPALGLDREPATAAGKQLWNAYRDSAAVETAGSCYVAGTEICQDAAVTTIDLSAVAAQLDSRAAALLSQMLAEAEDPAQLLGENREIPQNLKDQTLTQALTEALAAPDTVTRQVTLKLVQQDGQWWALPDAALLDVLSGGLN